MSRLHRVIGRPDAGRVEVADATGRVQSVSLLALDGAAPQPGEWLVVHSGYAIDRAEAVDAEAVAEEVRRAAAPRGDER